MNEKTVYVVTASLLHEDMLLVLGVFEHFNEAVRCVQETFLTAYPEKKDDLSFTTVLAGEFYQIVYKSRVVAVVSPYTMNSQNQFVNFIQRSVILRRFGV